MKKIYKNPEMEIIKLKAQYQLLAGSDVQAHDSEPDEYGGRGDNGYDW